VVLLTVDTRQASAIGGIGPALMGTTAKAIPSPPIGFTSQWIGSGFALNSPSSGYVTWTDSVAGYFERDGSYSPLSTYYISGTINGKLALTWVTNTVKELSNSGGGAPQWNQIITASTYTIGVVFQYQDNYVAP